MVSEDSDKAYISGLCSDIFKSIYRENQPHLVIADILIPIPPNTLGMWWLNIVISTVMSAKV